MDQGGRWVLSADDLGRKLGKAFPAGRTHPHRVRPAETFRLAAYLWHSGTIRLTDERARPRRQQTGDERRIKGKRGRALPMHPAFRKVLKDLPRHRDGLVFHGPKDGRLIDRRGLEALQRRVIESLKNEFPTPEGEIGFANGTVHGLRHSFVSEAYRNGATEAELPE